MTQGDPAPRVREPDPKSLDEVFNRVLHTEDDALRAARESAAAAGMPAIEVSAQHGRLLSLLARMAGAKRVLEIGTLAGYSTIDLARGGRTRRPGRDASSSTHGMRKWRRRTSSGQASPTVSRSSSAPRWTHCRAGGTRDAFDMFFIDADKENNVGYVEWAVKLVSRVVIVVDNISRMGRRAATLPTTITRPRRSATCST